MHPFTSPDRPAAERVRLRLRTFCAPQSTATATATAMAMAMLTASVLTLAVPPAMAGEPGSSAAHAAARSAVAPAVAADAVDPIETLRQRLAERLAGHRSAPSASGDLNLVARTGGAAVPALGAAAAARVVTKGRQPVHAPAMVDVAFHRQQAASGDGAAAPSGSAAWSYGGAAGPQTWGGLKPEYTLCGNGQRQSPIDIRGGLVVDLDPVRFDYRQSPFSVLDNGHTVQVNVAPGNRIDIGGRRFELRQFHFHRPSEERIDGRQFEMSLHLVHEDEQGRQAVVAVLFDKSGNGDTFDQPPPQPQPQVQKVWNALPLERHTEQAARAPLDVAGLLPEDRRYITYMGSLTTPPCSEGVQWVVMRQPVLLTPQQIDLFARIYPMNARPLQTVAGRRILQSQ